MKARVTAAFAAIAALWAAPALSAPCAPAPGAICAGNLALPDEAALIARLSAADVAILGERHDNPLHHQAQARIVAALAPRGLAFEMVRRMNEDAANAARASGGGLEKALDWAHSGWPDWAMYAPIFAAAPAARIAGGGLPRETLKQAIKTSAAAAFGAGAGRYGLDAPLDPETRADMVAEQFEAHCGALPEAMLPGMVEAQRLRDASFADAVERLVDDGLRPVALITGNGHARTDRGVPAYLAQAAPDLRVLSVGILEFDDEDDGENEPGALSDLFDFVIYTAPHPREDPCEAFIRARQDAADVSTGEKSE